MAAVSVKRSITFDRNQEWIPFELYNRPLQCRFFVSVIFYCIIYREYNMAACKQIEPVRDIINTKR